jgi:hypothetical protein
MNRNLLAMVVCLLSIATGWQLSLMVAALNDLHHILCLRRQRRVIHNIRFTIRWSVLQYYSTPSSRFRVPLAPSIL